MGMASLGVDYVRGGLGVARGSIGSGVCRS